MSYLALYRQFRPKTFEEIIGQDHVVKTLINQIKTNRVGHAYLFCGARGTGKTTAAKVFARAINCASPKNGSPCGECEVCKSLVSSSNLDILEMDAASNNGVDDIRELRDKIQYPPVAGKYKVYIIDEVHMLSPGAFNALLKTLEEPPSHAVFILATTEVHKIPATILSRCLRFDFKLISTAKIAQFICEIYDKVGKKYQKEAVTLIAKAGEGSVRDALSIADICLSYSENELTYNDVLEVLGTSDRAAIEQLIGAMFEGKTGEMLSLTEELLMRGKSVSILNSDVASALRDILVIKTCSNASEVLSIPEDKLNALKELSEKTNVHALLRSIEIFSACEADLKYSTHPKIVFETAAVKASLPQTDYNIDALMARISALETQIKNGEFTCKAPSVREQKPAYKSVIEENKQENVVAVATEKAKEGAVETNKKQTLVNTEKAKEEKERVEEDSISEVDEDLASLIASAPMEDFGEAGEEISFLTGDYQTKKPAYNAVNATNTAKKEESNGALLGEENTNGKAKQKTQTASASSKNVDQDWGALIRKLRQNKEIMLWVACQDVSVIESGGYIVINSPGENEYNLLSKPENLAKLNEYAIGFGYNGVKISTQQEETANNEQEEAEVAEVQDFLAGEKLEIKD